MEPIAFTLKDATGGLHTYECIPHPASEGMTIMWSLVSLGAAPLSRLLSGLLKGGDGGNLKGLLDDPNALVRLADSMDFPGLAADIKVSIQTMPMGPLTKQMLAKTLRDGKPLDRDGNFDGAYSRNYGELLSALWEVIKINRFLSLPST